MVLVDRPGLLEHFGIANRGLDKGDYVDKVYQWFPTEWTHLLAFARRLFLTPGYCVKASR